MHTIDAPIHLTETPRTETSTSASEYRSMPRAQSPVRLALSVVVPIYNERDNIASLLAEIATTLRGQLPFEIIYIDDHSSDDSLQVLKSMKHDYPELRVLHHGVQGGQSTAIRTGVKAARADWILTLDGDGQNDPSDIRTLLTARSRATPATKLFAGWRVNRKDTASTRVGWVRVSSWLPWMGMGDRAGSMYFHTAGRKLAKFDDMSAVLKGVIASD